MSGTGTFTHGGESHGSSARAARLLATIFRDVKAPFAVRMWDGATHGFGEGAPRFTLVLHDPRVIRELVFYRDPLRLADSYLRGEVDLEGDLFEALQLKDHLRRLTLSAGEKASLFAGALLLHGEAALAPETAGDERIPKRSERRNSRDSIAYHYDVSQAFYRLWLDEEMIYSCAVFESADETLEAAQRRKLDLICRKLSLKPGERLLDIGCGWGALVIHAAREYGVRALGITLSRDQHDFALERIGRLGLGERIRIERRDYRELEGEEPFDKIASVGMFEHVGLANLPRYFAVAHRLLKAGGLFLNHGITSREGGWRPDMYTRFINRHVFPDAQLDSVSSIQRTMEDGGFEVLDVENLRPSYALTLRHWVRRLEANRDAAIREAGERIYRTWRMYMAGCALQFERGDTGLYQILLAKAGEAWRAGEHAHWLTRRREWFAGT
jgi:cyclopropane-fatty-acyl-phospholipid synthase